MKSEHLVGTNIPRFTYDTPTVPENDFYALCEGSRPLCMIFLPGFDHPVSREYITRYLKTLPALKGARLACVVRSSANNDRDRHLKKTARAKIDTWLLHDSRLDRAEGIR